MKIQFHPTYQHALYRGDQTIISVTAFIWEHGDDGVLAAQDAH